MQGNRGGRKIGRARWLVQAAASALVCSAVAIPAPAAAQTATININIPAQPLAQALMQLSRQANVNVVAPSRLTRGRSAPAVRGSMSVGQALDQMLANSGLSHRTSGGGSIVISAGPGSGEAEAAGAAAQNEVADAAGISEILVVGSRSQNVDIRRSEDDPQPYVVFGREQIERSGARNLEEFLRTRLTMNAQVGSSVQNPTNGLGNISQVNLRGLGANQTLILVDGRRVAPVPTSSGQSYIQADINGIPLDAVERIEVLPSTASGIYGGGAVGGVINIIRKRDYDGFVVTAGYDGTVRGGGDSVRAGISGGFRIGSNGPRISLALSHRVSQALFVGDNELWREGRELFVRNDPNTSLIAGYTTNIRSTTGANLIFDNGTPLNSNRTFIPIGYSGVASDGGAALLANAGRYNLELSNDSFGRRNPLLGRNENNFVNANIRQSVGDVFDIFGDFTFSDNLTRSPVVLSGNTATIDANSPNNPFQQAINVTFPVIGPSGLSVVHSKTLSFAAGAIARISHDWTATAEYDWNRSRNMGSSTQTPFQTTAAAAFRNGTLDVMRDVNRYPVDYAAYLFQGPSITSGPYDATSGIASLRVAGNVLSLPGGRLSLSTLLEHRNETADLGITTLPTITLIAPRRTQSVDTAYAELTAPIFSNRNGVPFMHELELQASVRSDRYSTNAASPTSATVPPGGIPPTFTYSRTRLRSTDYTLAARWSPVNGVVFRASYGTGFLPPTINQLVARPNPLTGNSLILDPGRGNTPIVGTVASPVTLISSGNPNLAPESSRNFSVGAILTPAFLPRFRLSIDYTEIRKSGEIITPSAPFILANASLFPGRVVRASATLPGDPAGYLPPVVSLDTSLINIARSVNRGLDIQADYSLETRAFGTFTLSAAATHQVSFRRQQLPGTPDYEVAGYSDGPLRWRGNGELVWHIGNFSAGWALQYYDGYSVKLGDPAQTFLNNFNPTIQGSDRIPSQTYHDLSFSYELPVGSGGPLSRLTLYAAIQNVFDSRPPVVANALYGYSFYGDPRLRRFSIGLRKAF